MERAARADGVACVMAVHNVHHRVDVAAMEAVCSRLGVPWFLDSVSATAATARQRICGRDAVAEVFALHATKLLNGGEGGYVATNDAGLASAVRTLRTGVDVGGTPGFRCDPVPAHSALALACLPTLPDVIARNRARLQRYADGLGAVGGLSLVPYEAGEDHNYASVLLRVGPAFPVTRDRLVGLLNAQRVLTSQ